MGKIEQENKINTEVITKDIEREIQNVYNKFNSELARLMGPELKQCIDKNSDDPRKMMNCYDEFQKRISPALERLGLIKAENNSMLQKCLESKENMKVCSKIGLEKSQEYLTETFNDLKSYLA